MIAKCPCEHCGVNIEFEAENAGETVSCPSCEQQTNLIIPPQPQQPAPRQASNNAQTELAKLNTQIAELNRQRTQIAELNRQRIERIAECDGKSTIADALKVFAGLDFLGAFIGGLSVGQGYNGNSELGWAIFAGGVLGGLILFGFASLIEHAKESAERLKRIEIILQQTVSK